MKVEINLIVLYCIVYYKQVEEILLHCDDARSRTGIHTRRLNSEFVMEITT